MESVLHAACLLVSTSLQVGAPAGTAPPARPLSEVVVEGSRPAPPSHEAVARSRGVVDGLTTPTRGDHLIVRRFYPPCVKVVGVPAAYADVLGARMRATAGLVGLHAREGRCEPDVLVIFTPDIELFVQRAGLRDWNDQGDRFVAAPRDRLPPSPRRIASFKTFGELPATSGSGGSRIRSPVVHFYDRTILLLTDELAYDHSAEELGDYLAMLALTSADETSASPQRSIINLLAAPPNRNAASSLTAWDRSYLRAYYKAFAEMPDSVVLGQIARQMVNEGVPDR